jgi:hypothetical protein
MAYSMKVSGGISSPMRANAALADWRKTMPDQAEILDDLDRG